MKDKYQIEYDVDMDRFYIPVNSHYEIQTKGNGSSFRIANTETHERHLVSCEYVQAMLEDMARGTNAEIQQLRNRVTELEADAKRWKYFAETCSEEVAFYITGITGYVTNEQINVAIDAEMLRIGVEE